MNHPSLQEPDFDWGRFRHCPNCDLPTFDVEAGECRMCPPGDPIRGIGIAMLAGLAFWALVIWLVMG